MLETVQLLHVHVLTRIFSYCCLGLLFWHEYFRDEAADFDMLLALGCSQSQDEKLDKSLCMRPKHCFCVRIVYNYTVCTCIVLALVYTK